MILTHSTKGNTWKMEAGLEESLESSQSNRRQGLQIEVPVSVAVNVGKQSGLKREC